jgi:hypothetical protein
MASKIRLPLVQLNLKHVEAIHLPSNKMANISLDSLAPLILNPLTPMAFLPPQFGFEFTLLKYVFVGTLGVSHSFHRFSIGNSLEY